MSTGIYEKLLRPAQSPEDANDQALTDNIVQRVHSLDVLTERALLNEQMKHSNMWNLGDAVYGSFRHTTDYNQIRGIAAGARFTKHCRFDNHATVFGVEFSDDDAPAAPELVHITFDPTAVPDATGAGHGVLFMNCTFRRQSSSSPQHVYLESGAKAIFVGCVFLGRTDITGDVINNVGGAPKATYVQAIGCLNGTGNSIGTHVTSTGVLTIS